MSTKRYTRTGVAATLLLLIVVPLAMFSVGCNTAQSPNRQVSDIEITTHVKAKLASDVAASSLTNIEVNTTNGVVTLAGQVESAELRASAETVAQAVPGVVRVNNNLQVDPASAAR